uniref:ABC transporter domain-containing protein n=2 Tax=Clastoptera arizonana TaxID=38151 RepID=A0A1B6DIK2_9HEMI
MGFFLQLRMLLWKNFLIRKRQVVRCIVELLWPLFLFLILMWVRTRNLRTNIEQCYFTEKSMPSTGDLSFFQSFFCTFNNTCYQTVKDAEVYRGGINETMNFNKKILSLLKTYSSNQNSNQTFSGLQELADLARNILGRQTLLSETTRFHTSDILGNPDQLFNVIQEQNVSLSKEFVKELFNSEISVSNITMAQILALRQNSSMALCTDKEFLKNIIITKNIDLITSELCSLPMNQLKRLVSALARDVQTRNQFNQLIRYVAFNLNDSITLNEWLRIQELRDEISKEISAIQLSSRIMSDFSTLREVYQNSSSSNFSQFTEISSIISRFLCGNKSADFMESLSNLNGQTNRFNIRDRIENSWKKKAYQYDNSTTETCNRIFEQLDSMPVTKILWKILKPFIRGKILYTPETPATKRIMDKLAEVFRRVKVIQEATFNLGNSTINFLRQELTNNTFNLNLIKELYDSPLGNELLNNTWLRDILGPNYNEDVDKAREDIELFLNPNDTEYRIETFNKMAELNLNISNILECFYWDKIVAYSTEEEAMEVGMHLVEENELWALVVFLDPGNYTLNPLTTYKIRMNTDRIDDTSDIRDSLLRQGSRRNPAVDLKYITYGFAYLQDLLDHFIIEEQTGLSEVPGIVLQQMPYPCYISDRFIIAISRTFPLYMILSWVYTCAMIVKAIVYEKEKRLKETMRMMGLGNGIHWIGWFIDSFIPIIITISFLTVILVKGNILQSAEPSLVFCFLLIFGISTIALSFLISVFFNKANLSAASGGIIFFILYLPYPFMVRWILFLSPEIKTLLCMSSNAALGLGASYFSLYEEIGTGLKWENIWDSPIYDDGYCLAYIMGMLILDTFVYLFLTWYIESVFPGQFGIPKPWYFPVTLSFWLGRNTVSTQNMDNLILHDELSNNGDLFESEPEGLKTGIAIRQLGMKYTNGKVALSGLNLNFYEDQITSFLGHNGAGKTTTISILTGLFPPTQGTATIYGLDIRKDMDIIRNSLGMCPQHNVLFDLLTVEEHLWFYARLRGQKPDTVIVERDQMIDDLGLPHKRNTYSKDLSGGMQRKLSVAVAFIGGSKTVILDEPTSGVDPHSRRSIWELLIKYKKNRTVILTTHYMDEADLLGDRIAIISNGQLQTCGSSLFLKTHFGSGYFLSIAFYPPEAGGAVEENITSLVQDLKQFILEIMPSARLSEQIGDEVVFVLPQNNNSDDIASLLKALEANKKILHVHSYGISDTSLEDIFLKVADKGTTNVQQNSDSKKCMHFWKLLQIIPFFKKREENNKTTVRNKSTLQLNGVEREIRVQRKGPVVKYTSVPVLEDSPNIQQPPSNKYWRQFCALHIKRFRNTLRNKKALFSELVIPALFVCITLITTSILPTLQQRPPLPLSPWLYSPPRYMFYSNDVPSSPEINKYVDDINGPIGLGTKCIFVNKTRDSSCIAPSALKYQRSSNITGISKFGPDCSCSSGAQVCPADAGKPDPPNHLVVSDDTMYDLTGSNVSDWLMKTHNRFSRTRYGGYSLGLNSTSSSFNISELLGLYTELMNNLSQINNIDIDNLTQSTPSNNNIKVWYNNKGWASSVSYMNAINNVILRAALPATNASQYGINTINHPMNYTQQQIGTELLQQSFVSLLHAIAVIFALSFVPASFTLFLIEERVSWSKHLQLVSGVNRFIYWLQAFSWDLACYLVSAILCIFIFLLFNDKSYVSPTNFPGLLCLLVFYGWSVIPLMYPASYLFSVPSSAFVSLACGNMFVGIITTITVSVLRLFDDEDLKAVSSVLEEVFLVLPQYCLGSGLLELSTTYYQKLSLSTFDIEIEINIFAWNVLGKKLFCMFSAGLIFFLLTLSIEFGIIKRLIKYKKIPDIPEPTVEEEDVLEEKKRVIQGDTSRDILVIKNLCKVYKSSNSSKPATNHICVGVKKGECFGLLGLNGAGKTSTFKMLTGATKVSKGDATVKGYSVVNNLGKVRSLIGYCPQFDALNPLLTTREHLELYGRLRNIPSNQLQAAVDIALQKLNLGHYSDRCAGTLSGGNKRKLSTAIALLGDPPLVFLDEPTSGMDPKARRFIWSCIQDVIREGRSVVLTSHSMEECEALCTRLTIMVNGQFKCLGNSQHLKNKFGKGYSLVVRCKNDCITNVKEFIDQELPGAVLLEAHYNQIRYQLTMSNLKLHKVFSTMEAAKRSMIVEDYSLSQTTLEEVFIRFASEQSDTVKARFGLIKHIRRAITFKCCKCCVDPANNEEVQV